MDLIKRISCSSNIIRLLFRRLVSCTILFLVSAPESCGGRNRKMKGLGEFVVLRFISAMSFNLCCSSNTTVVY